MHYQQFLFSVMCKGSFEDDKNRRGNRVVLPPSGSSSQGTTPRSQREVTTTFFSSPRSQSSRRSEARSTAVRDEGARRSGGVVPRILFPQLKGGKLKRRVTISSGDLSSSSGGSGDVDEPDWPPSSDEDYIVFCFEEDGAFHVVMEESPKTLSRKSQCEDHGNVTCACTDNKDVNSLLRPVSRRDCLLSNKEAEDEEPDSTELSPKLQEDRTQGSDLLEKDKIELRKESTVSLECRNGSVESTDSSQLDYWEEQLLHEESDPEVVRSSSPRSSSGVEDNDANAFKRDYLLPEKIVDEEEMFLSPKSQLGMMIKFDSLLDDDNDCSSTVSDELCGSDGMDSTEDHDKLLEENEEPASESAKSSVSNQSASSFEFPVLEWEWVGSPVTWPTSGRLHFRKQKPRRTCLRCCRF